MLDRARLGIAFHRWKRGEGMGAWAWRSPALENIQTIAIVEASTIHLSSTTTAQRRRAATASRLRNALWLRRGVMYITTAGNNSSPDAFLVLLANTPACLPQPWYEETDRMLHTGFRQGWRDGFDWAHQGGMRARRRLFSFLKICRQPPSGVSTPWSVSAHRASTV